MSKFKISEYTYMQNKKLTCKPIPNYTNISVANIIPIKFLDYLNID